MRWGGGQIVESFVPKDQHSVIDAVGDWKPICMCYVVSSLDGTPTMQTSTHILSHVEHSLFCRA